VAFYVGGSEAGKQAGLSHTGALAGPDALYDGVFRQSGVIRAHSIPMVGFTFQSHEDLSVRKLLHYNVPVLPSPERASRAMAALVRYSGMLDKIGSQL